jgi:hypothetical protein
MNIDAIKQNKIKFMSDQKAMDSDGSFYCSGIAEQIETGKIKVSNFDMASLADSQNECFLFMRFEFLE